MEKRSALVLENHRLMVPMLRSALCEAGVDRITVTRRPTERTLRRVNPNLVVIDADAATCSVLPFIKNVRGRSDARIVVLSRSDDTAWTALARALGADTILGPAAGSRDLVAALAAPAPVRA